MRARRAMLWLITLLGTATIAAAQNPFVGTWKLDQAKSNLTGDAMKFGPAEGQAIELTAGGTKYSFRVDGNMYRMASGHLARWKQEDDSTWTTDYLKPDGTLLNTDTWKLSTDNKTLTVVTTGVKPNGEHYTDTAVYTRTDGTSGLLGAWKSTEVKMSSPNELTIAAYGIGGISLTISAIKAVATGNFDGKDVVPAGPTVPPGLTVAFVRAGPASFRLIEKVNGTVAYSALYTVSADGQTMTEQGNSPGDPLQTAIWEKQ